MAARQRQRSKDSAADISYCAPGHDLRSSLSFTAKRRSALPQEAPNKDREMETHRRSLCSHDLIRHGGARLSGSRGACCTDGRSESILRRAQELCGRLTELLSGEDALTTIIIFFFLDRGRATLPRRLTVRASYKVSCFSPQTSVMCPPQCLNMVFLRSKYGHLRHGKSVYNARGNLSSQREP